MSRQRRHPGTKKRMARAGVTRTTDQRRELHALARDLVRRGLASPLILSHAPRRQQITPDTTTEGSAR
ncbi:hypothetical protein HMPREF3105_09435 [Micrococcus sp. HMSC31B01]|uniref:hypothetical protein n=1 Tax=Micrococcus sp. HMSC31B01 TaxID=1581073 RepID=UPI0008A6021D|nr:hypothetical protein [Micrococcus sp. HMSC31B01]OFS08393.1 hypothetical protein HMPREF3105_09435 [Micrococcus sp. HMSC31B01]